MIRRLLRLLAEIKLDRVDAEIARWYVDDGQLSQHPLDRPALNGVGLGLRQRRLRAVAALERAGGRDPWPTVLEDPTELQRAAWPRRLQRAALGGRDFGVACGACVRQLPVGWHPGTGVVVGGRDGGSLTCDVCLRSMDAGTIIQRSDREACQ